MTTPLLLTLGLILSMFLLFVVLTTFSDSARGCRHFIGSADVGLTVLALCSLSTVEHSPDYWWPDLLEKIVWASAVQTGFGNRADCACALSTAASGSLSGGYSLNSFARLAACSALDVRCSTTHD